MVAKKALANDNRMGNEDVSRTIPASPVAKKIHVETSIHSRILIDDYKWLQEKSNPAVTQYLEAENAYCDAVMKPTEPLQQKLYKEMVSYVKETDVNVPYRRGGYFYYSRWEKGQQYAILARKKESTDAREAITIDVNQLAQGEKFMAVGAYNPSDDGNLLAYSTDNTGFWRYRLFIRDLCIGQDTPPIAEKVGSTAWANDNQWLFYTVEEEKTKRQYRLYRHIIGSAPGTNVLIFEEPD